MSRPLHLDVFVSPYKPIVGLIPPMSEGKATWPATAVSLIRDFDQALSVSHSAQELVDRMMVLHGGLGNPYTLWTAAQGVFEQGQGATKDTVQGGKA